MLACYTVASVVAALVGLGYAAGAPRWAPEMVDAVGYVPLLVFFAVATPVWAIFTMQDYLLTALKRATVVPVENLVFALLKLGLLAAAVGMSYVFGIAVSWVVATVLIVVAVNVWLLVHAIPQAATREPFEPVRPRAIARFVRSDYAGATLWQVAMNGLPALVLARLGAADAAVYGIVWTIAISLYLIPSGMGQSMIAHTAGDPTQAAAARRVMVRRSLALVVPAAAVLSVGAYPVLWLFGEHYALEGAWALALAALSAIPQVITAATVAQARVQQRMRVLVLVPGSLAVAVLVSAWLLMPVLGITGVALAWLVVQSVGAVVLLARERRPSRPDRESCVGARESCVRAADPFRWSRVRLPAAGRVEGELPGQRRCRERAGDRPQDRVAETSGRSAQAQHAVHLPGLPLQRRRARTAQRVVAGQRRDDVRRAGAVDQRAERRGVLEGLAAALPEVGGHRVGGVAEQGGPPDGEGG